MVGIMCIAQKLSLEKLGSSGASDRAADAIMQGMK